MVEQAIARLHELLEVGSAIMVATRDAGNRPHVTRGWGGRIDKATGRLDRCLTVSGDLPRSREPPPPGSIVGLARPTRFWVE